MGNLASILSAKKQFVFLLSNTLPWPNSCHKNSFCHCGKHITVLKYPSYLGWLCRKVLISPLALIPHGIFCIKKCCLFLYTALPSLYIFHIKDYLSPLYFCGTTLHWNKDCVDLQHFFSSVPLLSCTEYPHKVLFCHSPGPFKTYFSNLNNWDLVCRTW